MPTTLPVPSKSALRTLRNLALGTSCTVAFGAGLLTEDRRRRLNTAQKIHTNAKILKGSKQYHGAGNAALQILDERSAQYPEDVYWLPSNVLRQELAELIGSNKENEEEVEPPKRELASQSKILDIPRESQSRHKIPKTLIARICLPLLPQVKSKLSIGLQPGPNDKVQVLVEDVKRLLAASDVEAASAQFFQAFEEGFPVSEVGLHRALLDVAIQLAKSRDTSEGLTKEEHDDLYTFWIRILDVIRSCGPMDQQDFVSLNGRRILDHLMLRPPGLDSCISEQRIRKAAEIYLTPFKDKPIRRLLLRRKQWVKLFREFYHAGMYSLAVDIYKCILESSESKIPAAVDLLILATHELGKSEDIFQQFQLLYARTRPEQSQFSIITSKAIESLLELGEYDKAEKILVTATKMADKGRLKTATMWFTSILEAGWNSQKSISYTLAQLERFEPLLHASEHPFEVYVNVIRYFCEANEESLAFSIFNKLRTSHEDIDKIEILTSRVYGYFVIAKAKRQDWEGVVQTFHKWKHLQSSRHMHDLFEHAFFQVLSLFGKSHGFQETEKFVLACIEEFDLPLSDKLVKHVLLLYAENQKFGSLAQWLEFAIVDKGYALKPDFLNFLLKNCFEDYNNRLTFSSIINLCKSIWVIPGCSEFINKDTLSSLQRIATAEFLTSQEVVWRLGQLEFFVNHANKRLNLYEALKTTYALGDYATTLKMYRKAQEEGLKIMPSHLRFAVKASLKIDQPGLPETTKLVQDAKIKGMSVGPAVTAIYIYRLNEMRERGKGAAEAIADLAQQALIMFAETNFDVPLPFITHTMACLYYKTPQLAIDFWITSSARLGLKPDLVTLTVLLEAFIRQRDADGVIWVMKMIVADMRICPDVEFVLRLKNARRMCIDLLTKFPAKMEAERFLVVVLEALRVCKVLRHEDDFDESGARRVSRTRLIGGVFEGQAEREGVPI